MERTVQLLWSEDVSALPANAFAIFDDGSMWWLAMAPTSRGVVASRMWAGTPTAASTFQVVHPPPAYAESGLSYVLDGAGTLWLQEWIKVDANVERFQGLDDQTVLVLGTDGNLWQEPGQWNGFPPVGRVQVDAQVKQFYQAPNTENIFVLGIDGNLWLEQGPFGAIPPQRQPVDRTVAGFAAVDVIDFVWVLGTDFNLWLEFGPFGNIPPQRVLIDSNVQAFQPIDLNHVYVLRFDGTLWIEQGSSGTPTRTQIDANVVEFSAANSQNVLVRGSDRKVWLESGPWGAGPPHVFAADLTQPPNIAPWLYT